MPKSRTVKHILPPTEILVALGRIAIRHGQLDHQLKLCLKTFGVTTLDDLLADTNRETGKKLRQAVLKQAKQQFGDNETFERFSDMITRVWKLSERRNELFHGYWVTDESGMEFIHSNDGDQAWPKAEELEALAREINEARIQLNTARLNGWPLQAKGEVAVVVTGSIYSSSISADVTTVEIELDKIADVRDRAADP